jgi:hypothetical protein
VNRRQFMQVVAATFATPALAQTSGPWKIARPQSLQELSRDMAQSLFAGFLRNAAATSPDYVVCDYPGGTKLKGCCTPSGKTYVSVARMLPALVESADPEHRRVLNSIMRHAFDPQHADFWGYAPADKATQRSVEAVLVAWSLWRMKQQELDALTPAERTNIQKWLASCTQVPERKTNHAWFTAINQAVRIELSKRYPEFSGDEKWMLDDLAALDALYSDSGGGAEGWCSDSPDQPIYDLYNFYVFTNFPLMWGRVIGARYPQLYEKFRIRIRKFLETAPYFFGPNGSHPLMGRSLIYRWAVLSPLVLGYQEKLWPHSPGLLRRIVGMQLQFHQGLKCFDQEAGKLRETYAFNGLFGTDVAREPYVDNGHPYWAMLGLGFLSIPRNDPFWTAPDEYLPVSKGSYLLRFEGPRFLLAGNYESGEVRWIQAQNSAKRDTYRDKYSKFAWSNDFAFCASTDKGHVPPDQALVFRDIATGKEATRAPNGVIEGKLLTDGVETKWFAQLGDWKIDVVSRIRLIGEYEERTHHVTAPAEAIGKVLVREGTYAAGYRQAIDAWKLAGYDHEQEESMEGLNLIAPLVKVKVVSGPLSAANATFASLHFASGNPFPKDEILRRAKVIIAKWKE